MSEIDYTLRDYRYPNEGYDGCETFAGVLRTFFPRWCADGKAAGLPKSWLPATAEEYAMHYLNRILPLLDPNKPMHMTKKRISMAFWSSCGIFTILAIPHWNIIGT